MASGKRQRDREGAVGWSNAIQLCLTCDPARVVGLLLLERLLRDVAQPELGERGQDARPLLHPTPMSTFVLLP
jgi:hypothetical protein